MHAQVYAKQRHKHRLRSMWKILELDSNLSSNSAEKLAFLHYCNTSSQQPTDTKCAAHASGVGSEAACTTMYVVWCWPPRGAPVRQLSLQSHIWYSSSVPAYFYNIIDVVCSLCPQQRRRLKKRHRSIAVRVRLRTCTCLTEVREEMRCVCSLLYNLSCFGDQTVLVFSSGEQTYGTKRPRQRAPPLKPMVG